MKNCVYWLNKSLLRAVALIRAAAGMHCVPFSKRFDEPTLKKVRNADLIRH